MNIKIIKTELDWTKKFNASGSVSFLQAWEWGELQKKLGHQVDRVELVDGGEGIAIAQIIKQKVKRGNFLYIPHGPSITKTGYEKDLNLIRKTIDEILKYLKKIAKEQDYHFIRIAPWLENSIESRKLYKDLNFREAPIFINADEHIWVLPLDKDPEELLKQMRKTTRYLIRKAPKEGVTIEQRTDKQAIEDFWPVYEETTKRENFSPFPKNFIKEEFEAFHKTKNAKFFFGSVNKDLQTDMSSNSERKKYLASSLIVFTHSTAFYHQGASVHTKYPVTYALQWEAIKEAHKRGCKFYNFWGIAPEKDENHPWKGLTLFKKGFGGHKISFLPTQDYILSSRYYLTYAYEKWLRWRRGV